MDGSNGSAATLKGCNSGARRRRIVERGSDRLALITGRIKNLPSESETKSGSDQMRGHSYTVSCPPSISHIDLPSSDQSSEPLGTRSHDCVVNFLFSNYYLVRCGSLITLFNFLDELLDVCILFIYSLA